MKCQTEFEIMVVSPGANCAIHCDTRISVALVDGSARGYMLEVFGSHFTLPDLGPVVKRLTPSCIGCRALADQYSFVLGEC